MPAVVAVVVNTRVQEDRGGEAAGADGRCAEHVQPRGEPVLGEVALVLIYLWFHIGGEDRLVSTARRGPAVRNAFFSFFLFSGSI